MISQLKTKGGFVTSNTKTNANLPATFSQTPLVISSLVNSSTVSGMNYTIGQKVTELQKT
jgi:hypothetical protein